MEAVTKLVEIVSSLGGLRADNDLGDRVAKGSGIVGGQGG
jgi:hypothetical protein